MRAATVTSVRGLLRSARAVIAPVAALMTVTGLFRASQNMSQTTLSLLGRERVHAAPTTIGVLSATSFVVMLACTLLVAARIRPGARRAAVALGLAALLAGLVLFALAANVAVLATASVLTGIAGGITMPTLATIAGQVGPEQRDRTLALYALALSVSLAAGPLVESLVLGLAGGSLRATYLVFALMPALALVLIAARVRHGRGGQIAGPADLPARAEAAGMRATVSAAQKNGVAGEALRRSAPAPRGSYRAVAAQPLWRLAVIGVLMYEFPFVCVVTFGAVLAESVYGQRATVVELSFAAFFAASLASRAALAWRSPIRRKLRLLWLSVLTTVVGLILLGAGRTVAELVVAMAVLGVPHGLTYPIALGLSADGVPHGDLARANAALMSALNLTAVLAPGLLGAIAAAAGYRAMVAACLAPVGCCALALAWQGRCARHASHGV